MVKVLNAMESVVYDKLELILEKEEAGCRCEQCMSDVICLTLNKIPPKYVASDAGVLLTKVSVVTHQDEIDILNKIVESLVIVRKNPRHK